MEPLGAPPNGFGLRFLKCVASAVSIDGLRTCATLNMIGFVRLRSMKARNWFSMYSGCCPGQPRHRKISEITLARQPVAGLAIFQLGLEAALPGERASVLRVTGRGKSHRQQRRLQCQPQAGDLHDPASAPTA